MSDWIKDYDTAEMLVKAIMRDYPETRSDDRKLILKVWRAQGLDLTLEQERRFEKCLPSETITRARRKWHSRKVYLPPQEIVDSRQIKAEEVRNVMKEE